MTKRAVGFAPRGGVWLSLLLSLAACKPLDLADGPLDAAAAPPAELIDVKFEAYSAGERDVLVRAERAEVQPQERVAYLYGVRIDFADEGRGPIHIEAARAEFELDSDDFVLSGGVEGRARGSERFTTEEVRYEREHNRLWSIHPVRVTDDHLVLHGAGMELDLAERRIRLTGRVRAEITPR